jgi:hypothetical protein
VPRARLAVDLPDTVWVGRLSRAFPDATFRVLSAFATDAGGVGVVEVTAPDPTAVLAGVEERADLTDLTTLHAAADRVLVQFETTEPHLLRAVGAAGAPVDLPLDIVDGTARVTVTAAHERLAALGKRFDAAGLDYRLESLDGAPFERSDPLTDGQRELLEAALAAGYYDTPRRCTLTDLADRTERAKSTVSETLHRAESALVRAYFDR